MFALAGKTAGILTRSLSIFFQIKYRALVFPKNPYINELVLPSKFLTTVLPPPQTNMRHDVIISHDDQGLEEYSHSREILIFDFCFGRYHLIARVFRQLV